MTNAKGQITKVQIGNIEIDGVMLPDGSYGISVSQMVDMNLVESKETASRDLKRLLGETLVASKVMLPSSDGGRHKQNTVLSLTAFEKALAKLDRAGNKKAQDLRDDLAGVMLEQLFAKAFGQKFELEDIQKKLSERQTHRDNYRELVAKWVAHDGLTHQYAYEGRISQLKKAAGLKGNLSVNKMEYKELSILNQAEVMYDKLRRAGMDNTMAISLIRM